MKTRFLLIPVLMGALLPSAVSMAATISEVKFPGGMPENLAEIAGAPVALRTTAEGDITAYLPDGAVRRLRAQGLAFEVLSAVTDLQGADPAKALVSVSGQNLVSFPINPPDSSAITISGAPGGAVVSSVTARIHGLCMYADLCAFQLRDAVNTTYTFPTWYDEIEFDRTVTGISSFNGRPVNQVWTLWGQGGNVSGEYVNEWWITIYYEEVAQEGEPDPLRIAAGPLGGWHEEGTPVELRVVAAGGTPPYAYLWTLNGGTLPSQIDSVLSIPAVGPEHEGDYRCQVTDAADTMVESAAANIRVVELGGLPAAGATGLSGLAVALAAVGVRLGNARRKKNIDALEGEI